MIIKGAIRLILGLGFLSLLLFLPAGTFNYPNAYLLMILLFAPMMILGLVLHLKKPELLKKRLNYKEENKAQKIVIMLSALMFTFMFIISSLDFRFGWSKLSDVIIILAIPIFLTGYILYAETMRENEYLSRTIEIQEEQKVIDTGLYSFCRNPMYFATLLIFLTMPLILGSLYGFLIILISYPPIIIWRIMDEEKTLKKGLTGYDEYMKKVKYRLIPYIW